MSTEPEEPDDTHRSRKTFAERMGESIPDNRFRRVRAAARTGINSLSPTQLYVVNTMVFLANIYVALAILPKLVLGDLIGVAQGIGHGSDTPTPTPQSSTNSGGGVDGIWDGVATIVSDVICGTPLSALLSLLLAGLFLYLLFQAGFEMVQGLRNRNSKSSKEVSKGNNQVKSAAYTAIGAFLIPTFLIAVPEALSLPALDCLI